MEETNLKDDRVKDELGIVVIGRNEGERLRRCLESVSRGGHEGGLRRFRLHGRQRRLCPRHGLGRRGAGPFSTVLGGPGPERGIRAAPRDRPRGPAGPVRRRRLRTFRGLARASGPVLDERHEVAAVCGRLRERHPERSVYNRLADLEWNGPVGEIKACGGIAMIRAEAFEAVGGFDPSIIAAEDDELCLRIRRRGWKIVRIDAEMALDDIAMYRFRQWWRRSTRTGHAYAEGSAMYGHTPERHFVRPTAQRGLLGHHCPDRRPRPGLADPGDQPRPPGRLCHPLLADLPLLRPASRLAAGGCSPERRLDRPRQVPPGRRRGPVLARSTERRAERRHRARDLVRAEGSVPR